MSTVTATSLPDHTQLPDSDGKPVESLQEHPQSVLLTETLWPVLRERQPDGQFIMCSNSGIYWRATDPPQGGCKAPDWYCVLGVPPNLDGQRRRSYVLWQEIIPPLIILEIVSGEGAEERDQTPWEGKFWVYEYAIRPGFYGIFNPDDASLEMHQQFQGRFVRMEPNLHGRFAIPRLGVELGVWHGEYLAMELNYLRWWDAHGNLLLDGHEQSARLERQLEAERRRAEAERQRAESERHRAEAAEERIARLEAQLRTLGKNPNGA